MVLATLAASTVACGSGSTMTATGPSSLSGSGAVISGRVTMSGSASAVSARAPLALVVLPMAVAVPMAGNGAAAGNSVTVTIVGTGASTTLDGNGSFTLDNVPPGAVTLRFQGRGSDALLTIAGIEADDHISIAVTLNGNNARLDKRDTDNRGNGVQVNGRIDQIDTANQLLRVNLQTVLVQQATFIRHGNRTFRFSDLRVGDHVQVKGRRDGASFVATEIKVETAGA